MWSAADYELRCGAVAIDQFAVAWLRHVAMKALAK